MCVDHAEELGRLQVLSYVTYAPIGITTAAEVFIFLSGLTLGLAYQPVYQHRGYALLHARCAVRAWQLFLLHVLALVMTVAVITLLPGLLGSDTESVRMSRAISTSNGMLARFATLRANPQYFDILPLYIVLLLALPPFFPLLNRSRAAGLAVAAAIYLGVQAVVASAGAGALPFSASLYYNPLAWQLLFVSGLAVGVHRRLGGRLPGLSRGTVLAAIGMLLVLGAWYKGARVNALLGWYGDTGFVAGEGVAYDVPLIDKPTLGPIRYVHFLVLTALVARWCPADAPWLRHRWAAPVVTCGRQALEVFVFGIVVTYAAGVAMQALGGGRVLMVVLDAAAVAGSCGLAYLVSWRKSEPWRLRLQPDRIE
jgi:hypothetical protein